jgi:hypothetical protein
MYHCPQIKNLFKKFKNVHQKIRKVSFLKNSLKNGIKQLNHNLNFLKKLLFYKGLKNNHQSQINYQQANKILQDKKINPLKKQSKKDKI